jgi:very-short-patch-repair endonuclease
VERLRRVAESSLEKAWLQAVDEAGYAMPGEGQPYIEAANARPDFVYPDSFVAVFIDGPVHDNEDVKQRDAAAQGRLENAGYYVIRFGPDPGEWGTVFEANPNVFGRRS